MTLPSRKTLLANAVSLVVLGWLYGGDALHAVRARDAEVAAFSRLPSVVAPSVVLVLMGAVAAVVGWGLAKRRGEDFKGYRLMPILLVGALMVDLLRSDAAEYLSSSELSASALQLFRDEAGALATAEAVPTDAARLQAVVEKLGAAPYLVHGQPVGPYTLQVRQGCSGPVLETQGARPGTLFYCVAQDASEAWVSLVGLPAEQRFGAPAIVSVGGAPQVVRVVPQQPAEQGAPSMAGLPPLSGAEPLDGGMAGPAEVP
jgi:hypothetical protein